MNAIGLPTLEQMLQQVRRLPPLRAIVLDVLRNLDQPQANLTGLARGISRDLALSAAALRMVNSPFYGLPHKVDSVQQAVMILGSSNLRGLVAAMALVNDYALPRDGCFDAGRFWLHSFGCAVWARLLATRLHEAGDLAFTAGLLHDVGKLVLALRFGELCREIARRAGAEGRAAEAIEREMLGFDHAAIGAELLAHWQLPERLVRAAALHHAAPEHGEDPICALIRSANQIEPMLDADETVTLARLRPVLRLPDAEIEALVAAARRECGTLSALLKTDGGAT
jgi:putative nucleotidyltransferase with HDIG domain